jgi:glycosyltransferase involved in cell wall biosynthesis
MEKLGDPYDPNWDAFQWSTPDWVHVWDDRKSWYPYSRTLKWLSLLRMLRGYDLVVGHAPFAKIATFYSTLFRKPYALYDAGWIRYLKQNRSGYSRARKGYGEAPLIFFTNVDTEHMFKEQGYSKLAYTPFAIDTKQYSPRRNSSEEQNPVFFHPARHSWDEKGNDRLIIAFARYVQRNPQAKLAMVEWYQSPDHLVRSKQLVSELGIQGNVLWVPVMSKNRLIEQYRRSTAVFDQFLFGAFGTTAPEAMSCGIPVVGYVDGRLWTRYHDEPPPVINASTVGEIYTAMIALEDEAVRRRYGERGRDWVINNCDSVLVASKQLEGYNSILSEK